MNEMNERFFYTNFVISALYDTLKQINGEGYFSDEYDNEWQRECFWQHLNVRLQCSLGQV
jgi:hypothetical protein